MDRREFLKKAGALSLSTAALTAVGVPMIGEAQAQKGKSKGGVKSNWDVIIIGGGPSGIAAAISASREGSKVLVIERTGVLGGMSTAGMIPVWCPYTDKTKIIYKGIAEKILRISKKGVAEVEPSPTKYDWSAINAEYMKRQYDLLLKEAKVDVLFFSFVAAVEKSGNNIVEAITVANKAGLTTYKAKVFIDCSGDGDVATWAGAAFNTTPLDEIQASTLCFSLANVDTDAYLKGPRLHGSNKQSPVWDGIRSGKFPLIDGHINNTLTQPGVIQFNAGHIRNIDSTNPELLSGAMPIGRQIAEQYCQMLREFYPSAFGNAGVVNTAQLLGIRESRRIVCDYTLTVDDWLARRTFPDEIGRNNYYIDRHSNKATKYPHMGKGESHGIPYRILTPKGLKNVLVAGRCVSTDAATYGSMRVMPPSMVTGEAAGMAAVHAIKKNGCDVHTVDTDFLRKRLKEEGQNIQ